MKKIVFLLMGIMMVSAMSFSAEQKSSIESSLNSIESQFNNLMKKEGRDKTAEKLRQDSEVRWHRDKYKNILREFDQYTKNIDKMIAEKEKKINELEALLSIMN